MSIELTDSLKAQIVLAAVGAAGGDASDGEVATHVARITSLLADGSPAMAAFDHAAQRAEATVTTKSFTGTILFVDLEQSSNRPIVFLRTEPSNYHPDGIEHFRLDRTDSRDGERVKALAKEATALVGHKVLVTVGVERAGDKNVRILRAVEDRGVDSSVEGLDNAQGALMVDWQQRDRAQIAPKLVRLQRVLAGAQAAPAAATPVGQSA